MKREPGELGFTFTVTDHVDANDLINLIMNALDSGALDYWVDSSEVIYPMGFDISDIPWLRNPEDWKIVDKMYLAPFVEGGRITLYNHNDVEEDYVLDLKAIKRGVQCMSSKYGKHWRDFRNESDDAITADVFVQCCIFGEIVYG